MKLEQILPKGKKFNAYRLMLEGPEFIKLLKM